MFLITFVRYVGYSFKNRLVYLMRFHSSVHVQQGVFIALTILNYSSLIVFTSAYWLFITTQRFHLSFLKRFSVSKSNVHTGLTVVGLTISVVLCFEILKVCADSVQTYTSTNHLNDKLRIT